MALLGDHFVGHAAGFLIAKTVVAVAVFLVILGIGLLAFRWQGPLASVVAALLYAAFEPGVRNELPIRLEPLVNLAFVTAAAICLRGARQGPVDRASIAGAGLAGLAVISKLTGAVVLVGILASRSFDRPVLSRLLLCLITVLVVALTVAPFAAEDLERFLQQVVFTQADRPGGEIPLTTRIVHMLQVGPSYSIAQRAPEAGVVLLLGIYGPAVVLAWLRGGMDGRFWSSTWLATAVILLWAPSYYAQYSLILAVPSSILLGSGVTRAVKLIHPQWAAAAALIAVVVTVLIPSRHVMSEQWHGKASGTTSILQQLVPAGECVFSDPPTLGIAAGILPPPDKNGPLIDPFGELMHIALRDGRRFPSTMAALWSAPAQERLREAMSACRFAASAFRLEYQHRLSPSTRDWVRSNFELVGGPDLGIHVWERRDDD